jgi:hypothetical protein
MRRGCTKPTLEQLHQRPAGYQTRRRWIEDADGPEDTAGATSRGEDT